MNKTMTELIRVPATGDEPEIVSEPEAVHFDRVFGGHPGTKTSVVIDLPAPWDDDGAAKDTLKELDYHSTGRSWDGDSWVCYLKALNQVVEHMCAAGYDVTVDVNVAKDFEKGLGGAPNGRVFLPDRRDEEPVVDEPTIESARNLSDGDRVTVQRNEGEDVSGTVSEVKRYDSGVIVNFERDSDGHTMRLSVFTDGINLSTTRSGSGDNGTHAIVEEDVTFEPAYFSEPPTEDDVHFDVEKTDIEAETGDRIVVHADERTYEGVVVGFETKYKHSRKVNRGTTSAEAIAFERDDGHRMYVYDYGFVADLYNYRRQSSGRNHNGSRAIVASNVAVEVLPAEDDGFARPEEFDLRDIEVGDEVALKLPNGDVLTETAVEAYDESAGRKTRRVVTFEETPEFDEDNRRAARVDQSGADDGITYLEGDIAEPEYDYHSVIGVRVESTAAEEPVTDGGERSGVETRVMTDGGVDEREESYRAIAGHGPNPEVWPFSATPGVRYGDRVTVTFNNRYDGRFKPETSVTGTVEHADHDAKHGGVVCLKVAVDDSERTVSVKSNGDVVVYTGNTIDGTTVGSVIQRKTIREVEPLGTDSDSSSASEPETNDEPESFVEEYAAEVRFTAECVRDEVAYNLYGDEDASLEFGLHERHGEVDDAIFDTLTAHEYVTKSEYYLPVLSASPSNPEALEWRAYVDFDIEGGPSANAVLGAMAYVAFRNDLLDAVFGEFSPTSA